MQKVDKYEINDITFAQERELYNLYKKSYRNSSLNENGKVTKLNVDWDSHDSCIAKCIELAFDDPQKTLQHLKHPEIDELGQQILLRYLRMDGESKKESGD
tara:strand:- start:672 stop:974 length:303 start_codon:yes stop_codon:yes gene_type:complete